MALDLNPRTFGQMGLSVANGNDLPLLWLADLLGKPMPAINKPKVPVEFGVHRIWYHTSVAAAKMRGEMTAESLELTRKISRSRSTDLSFVDGDTLGYISSQLRLIRKIRGMVR